MKTYGWRKSYTEEEKITFVKRWLKSHTSITEFAKFYGLPFGQVNRWIHKYKDEVKE